MRDADSFDHWNDDDGEHFSHRPNYKQTGTRPILVYAHARLTNGGRYFEPIEWEEIDNFRELSKAKADDSPWSAWPHEMGKIRPIKRLCKRLPMTPEARAAFARDEAREARLFDPVPDDPLDAINRNIREGKAKPATGAQPALTDDPSPIIDWPIAASPAEHVTRQPAANDASTKSRRAKKVAPTVEREPTLEEVLERIDTAGDPDELGAAGALAAKMRSEGAKKIARDAYGQKMAVLRSAALATQTPNEHDAQDARPGAALSYAKVRGQLERADSLEALDEAAANIGAVPQPEHRDELIDIAQALRDGFTQ